MNEPSWIGVETVCALQRRQIDLHGGIHGLRDLGLVESAVARPLQVFQYETPLPTIERLAAAYGHGLAKNHGFLDGNKRIAAVTSIVFLRVNQRSLEASSQDVFELFTAIASGGADELAVIAWFEERCTRAPAWQSTRPSRPKS